MRFKQYLSENRNMIRIANDWLDPFEISYLERGDMKWRRADLAADIIGEDGVVDAEISELEIRSKLQPQTFSWPISKEVGYAQLILSVAGERLSNYMTIKDFTDFPKVHMIIVDCAVIEAFDGLDKIKDQIAIEFRGPIRLTGGILKLLKPNIHISCDFETKGDFYDALKIVMKHKEENDGDIADCQEELIDANLEAYAKL